MNGPSKKVYVYPQGALSTADMNNTILTHHNDGYELEAIIPVPDTGTGPDLIMLFVQEGRPKRPIKTPKSE